MMSIDTFIGVLQGRGCEFSLDDSGQLKFRAPNGVITPDLLDVLKSRKPEIIAYLGAPAGDQEPQDRNRDWWLENVWIDPDDPFRRLDDCPTPILGRQLLLRTATHFLHSTHAAGTPAWEIDPANVWSIACPHRRILAIDGLARQAADLKDDPDCDRRLLVWLGDDVRWLLIEDVIMPP